jgi:diguanylate cyclase (GGDEF)-like protein
MRLRTCMTNISRTALPGRAALSVPAVATGHGEVRWRSRRHYFWAVLAAALVVSGVAAAVLGAGSTAHADATRSDRSLTRSSDDIASTLQLAIQHQNDLAVDAGAYFLANPTGTQADFSLWTAAARTLARYPELQGLTKIVRLSASDVPAYAARTVSTPGSDPGPFAIVPSGDRPFYCFSALSQVRSSSLNAPAGEDLCAEGDIGASLAAARNSGQGSYVPYTVGGHALLGIETPLYTGGQVPPTLAARQDAFAGWVGTVVEPQVLLDQALHNNPAMSVSLRFHGGASDVTFASGHAPANARSVSTDLHNGWTVRSSGAVGSSGIFENGNAATLFYVVTALSVLLGALVFTLGTGRERARRHLGQRTNELQHQALHDPLTGLPNRALVMDRIEQMLVRDRRQRTTGAALFLDLDDFKNVNDTMGHRAGDRLLVAVAARIAGTLRDADTVGRMGGDEFVVLIDGAAADVALDLVAERLLAVMRQPFELEDAAMPLLVSVSIGIASGDRPNAGALLHDADVALYEAKEGGKNGYEIFDPLMQNSASRRSELEFELRSALARDEYRLVYQPIYNLDDLTVVGVEALLRWDHPTKGLVGPDEFIPLLEQTGHIREVGRWVLNQACRQMSIWHSRGNTLDVSVNVSGRQLDHDGIVSDVREALDRSGLAASSLIIEVTETALMHNIAATAGRLRAIKELGVRIAVDDFGTGYSSLAYLRQFPVDCLKIDRMFTSAITTSPESKALVGTLVQLGKDLGLSTLAEGVETTDEMDLLRVARVDQAQGFLMARPLDADALEAQLLVPARSSTPTSRS